MTWRKRTIQELQKESLSPFEWNMTFEERCRLSEQCLPNAPYRDKLTTLHNEMLKALAQPEQEPVAWMYPDDHKRMLTSETFCTVYSVEVGSAIKGESTVPLYTTPPQRKPLTDEEISEIAINNPPMVHEFARAIEAAHNIKGGA